MQDHSTVVALLFASILWEAWLHCNAAAKQERCRALLFRGGMEYLDSSFNKSIIKNVIVKSKDQCWIACFIEIGCKSYNLGPSPQGDVGELVCELSSSTHVFHQNNLVQRPGFTYHPSKELCVPACPDNTTCFPDGVGYSCFCTDPGFQGDRCDQDFDECSTNAHDCAVDALCSNNVGSFTCTCREGYEGNGKTCQDKDECSQGQHNCHVSATCQNTLGSFNCACLPGEISDGIACADFPFHWTFNGTDRFLTLQGAARFEDQDGRTVLYLDGTSGTYAETPAIPLQQTNLTMTAWIKRTPSPSSRQMIYGDWSSPHQFRFDVMTDDRLCTDVRRDSSVAPGLVNFCTPWANTRVPANVWSHVAFTWSRTQGTAKLYINGVHHASKSADTSIDSTLDLKNSGHSVYDIGLIRGSGKTTNAYFSDLMIFNRELSENEIRNDLVVNHPFHIFV